MTTPKRALIVVDVQNDFCPGGTLAVPHGDTVVEPLNHVIDEFLERGELVYKSRDWHPPTTKHFAAHGGVWPVHCVQDTKGAEFHPALRNDPRITVISKGLGLDIRDLLDAARLAAKAVTPAVELGTAIGDYANEGRDKLTLVIDQKLETLGLWIEQLIAESTGKEGKGILPVNGEPLGTPDVYGNDRVFVSISLSAVSQDTQAKLDALAAAGHPVINRKLERFSPWGMSFEN